jgi:lipoate-protein ligase A
MRGAESYRVIHRALADAMTAEGCGALLADHTSRQAGGLCFIQPVEHDLLDASGRKLAGAGQRRNRTGLLHQGSVALPLTTFNDSTQRARHLAAALAETIDEAGFHPPEHDLSARIARRYANPEWTARR